MRRYTRTASLAITTVGLVINTIITLYVFSGWSSSYKWEPESEWESKTGYWRVDGVKLLWGLLSAYFSSAAIVCGVGLFGILKNRPTYIRFYRDYTIADFCFCSFFITLAAYGSFRGQTRAGVCEHFSEYPELMRDMLEMGLSIENCELWLERAVLASLAVLFIVLAVRLHFLLALSNYYSHLIRYHRPGSSKSLSLSSCGSSSSSSSHSSHSSISSSSAPQRIYLLPGPPPQKGVDGHPTIDVVYAPVPIDSLPLEMQVQAVEAWVQRSPASSHSHSHSREDVVSPTHSHSSSSSLTSSQRRELRSHRRRSGSGEVALGAVSQGRIRLATQPEEGLLPSYSKSAPGKA
ncbi:hypothetical protein DFP72DRAFT_877499 [Ephemerocybe angulata]|uniref:Uncharacterized protein n=1 Tax=Ephemerocybe angulata TaxID=980116 RepID=A0A8H6ICY1_9AGAR|nr:hypothetical protein DFP72DRAFT_877499 [Tulosesus angulatus]